MIRDENGNDDELARAAFDAYIDAANEDLSPEDIDMSAAGATSVLNALPEQEIANLTFEAGIDPASLSDNQIMEALYQLR